MKRPRVDVNLEELDQIIDRGTHAPLSESEGEKLKGALHALAGMLAKPRSTEKTSVVLEPSGAPPKESITPPQGHGRNGARAYTGAKKVAVPHATLHAGDPCPGCGKGKVYPQKEPRTLVRIVGQAPLAATVYELDRLRCNLCGEVFTAPEPESIGPEKYDETTAAMIALLKYGSGMPFYRLEKLEHVLGIPLPSSTQWEIVEEAAEVIKAARDELIRQAAQGEVLHNDDTSMRVLRLAREPSDDRTGVFTSGMLNQFVHLWQETPESIFRFARKWGVLNLDQEGRPCRPIGPFERRESIDAWHYYSRRAQAVLNIAASLKLGNIGAVEDWEALRGTASRTGNLLEELDRVEPFLLTMLPRVEYPFGSVKKTVNPRYKRSVKSEMAFLSMEATLWLGLGRVGFTVAPKDSGWMLVVDYNGCMLAAVALQLALVLADVDALYQCSGCHEPYVRAKRAPRPGEANFCERCGRKKALQKADEKRREKIKRARRLAEEGVSPVDIAQRLDSRLATVYGWIMKPEQIRKRPLRRRRTSPSKPN